MTEQYCLDRIHIQDVLLNYAAAVDARDMVRYGACFTDDVVVVGFGEATITGRQNWLDYVGSALQRYSTTQHLIGPVLAQVEGDLATARTDVQALHFLADGGARFTLWATYHSRLSRQADGWRICRHELVVCGSATD